MSTSTSNPVTADSSTSTTIPAPTLTTNPKLARRLPCLPCQRRKVKCDRNEPCSNCVKGRVECVSPNPALPRKRKRRFAEAELLARLRRYEAYFIENGVDADTIGHTATDRALEREATTEASTPRVSLSVPRSPRTLKNGNLLNDQFHEAEQILQGSSDDDGSFEVQPMTRSFDTREAGTADSYDLVFEEQGKQGRLTALHPSPLDIFRLWQLFLNNVNPLIKLVHAPTVQQQILDASADLQGVPANTEALMFGVYSMSIASITTGECHAFFGRERGLLLAQYHAGARKALANASLLRSSDLVTLQAFALYLLSNSQGASDPRSLFCLTGIAMRIARRMGLDRDGASLGLPPFEVEMRRRLWWQLLLIDHRVSEISGSPPPSYSWSTKPPANVNDNDLFAGMRDVPVKSERLTEMTFVSVRCEIFDFHRKVQASTVDSLTGTKEDDERIDAFERHLESEFLTLCDHSAPLRAMSVLMAQLELWKLRSGLYRPRMLPDSRRRQLPQAEQDMIFSACLKVMECHNAMLATESVQRFVWYAFTNPPFLAYLYLLWGLRARTKGELADRAWNQLAEHVKHRKKHDSWDYAKGSNPLRLAIANLTIKAWDALQAASPQEEVEEEPRFISDLRGRLPHGGGSGSSTAAPLTTCDSFLNPAGMPGLVPELDAFSLPDLSLDGEWPAYMDFLQGEEAMSRFGETQCFDN